MRNQTPRELRAARLLRAIRNHPALYSEDDATAAQAARIRDKCKVRLAAYFADSYAEREHACGQRLLYTWA